MPKKSQEKINLEINKKYGYFTVESHFIKNKRHYYKCRCKCGIVIDVIDYNLKRLNHSKVCKKCFIVSTRKYKIGDITNSGFIIADYDINDNTYIVVCLCNDIIKKRVSDIERDIGCVKCKTLNFSGRKSFNYKGCEYVTGTYFNGIYHNAKKRNLEFKISIEYIDNLLKKQNFKCALSDLPIYIGFDFDITASLDRIDSNIGYLENNVQWVHKHINIMKMGLSEDLFKYLCCKVSEKIKNG